MKKRISEKFQLPAAMQEVPNPAHPLVEIAGTGRVLIENHMGVTQYEKETIRVKTRYGGICISGQELVLSGMTRGKLEIKGRIHGVTLLRGCEK